MTTEPLLDSGQLNYGSYLHLDQLLNAQHPASSPAHHDELLFIVQHQTTELWIKLMIHELSSASERFAADDPATALKRLARVKHIQETMTHQWSVLATLTPSEYSEFRGSLGTSSGFQSYQYRVLEFLLGNKNASLLQVFERQPDAHAAVEAALHSPTLYDQFLRWAARQGLLIPARVLERDVTQAYRLDEDLIDVFASVYENPDAHWAVYETCEELVDVEENFQLWRFRHLRTVQRTIGMGTGTGGSSGVKFLERALSITFFPELFEVRTRISAL
ncbi:MAG: tryptophan 2,3-dioxygenase [Microbacteriaceae bacterium]|nr:tryptophan 2,3-dioxygenase [Microbacteriaceae bacterium]